MEDISRELAREIETYSRSGPSKRKGDKRLILVDDFGKLKSADWIRKSAWVLFFLCVVLGGALFLYWYLYSNIKAENQKLSEKLAAAENKIDSLTEEKALLMAKVVMSGKDLPFKQSAAEGGDTAEEKPDGNGDGAERKPDGTDVTSEAADKTASVSGTQADEKEKPAESGKPEEEGIAGSPDESEETDREGSEAHTGDVDEKTVSIGRFRIVEDGNNGDLLVRFRINNISDKAGDSSGYIFVMLTDETDASQKQLIVPTVSLENGIPAQYSKGQYFSIAHYKPVKFRIKEQLDSDAFETAVVFVFDTKGKLLLEKHINLKG